MGRLPAGYEYTLPTEAQWEYACRAGTTTPFSFGSALNGDKANCNGNVPYGCVAEGCNLNSTAKVASYAPNAWGLYDMHGNVWEWCRDCCEWKNGVGALTGTYYKDSAVDPWCRNGRLRVYRGGSWFSNASYCRAAYRNYSDPSLRNNTIGFRIALAPVQKNGLGPKA